jgi:hypothetical protein
MRKRRNEADLASTRRCVIGIRSSAPPSTPSLTGWYFAGEICGETPPDFRRRSSWYTTKMLPGKLSLPRKEISDDTQRNWIVSALEAVAVDSSKAVHVIRQSVARLADRWEVPAD